MNERKLLHLKNASEGSVVTRIGLAVSDICNLGCSHCIHFQPALNEGKGIPIYAKPKNQLMMSWDVAKTCVDLYIDLNRNSSSSRNCKIRFGNAEPLVNWPVIEKVLEYCSSIKDVSFEFSINTNLLLMDCDIAKSLKKYGVYIATSLDGATALANDSIRVRNDGKGTFQKILEKFDILADIGYPLDGFGVTVTSANFDMIDTNIIELAAERGMTEIAFDFDLVSLINVSVEDRVEKLMKIKRCADASGIYLFGMWDTPFRNLTEKTVSCSNSFCDAVGGRALEFNSDGSIKTCSHMTTTVGSINQFSDVFNADGDYLDLIKSRFPGSQKSCKGCEIEGLCGGQCHVTQEVSLRMNADDFQNLFNDMCVFYRAITRALIIDHIRANEYDLAE
jgi:radical SAM protein with 4Fe4S-binding SPASM domain